MNVAKVIVDVPASTINQTFDYGIPTKLKDVIKPGMRVVIPFGPRKITGFVIDLKATSEFAKLKDIMEVLDITPVLTTELLQLGKWLADSTLSLYISTYQAMLPQILRAKYKKEVVLLNDDPLTVELELLFKDRQAVPYETVLEKVASLKQLQDFIEAGTFTIHYLVKSQITKKYKTMITPVSVDELQMALVSLSAQAVRQREIIEYFIRNNEAIDRKELNDHLKITSANTKPLVEKKLLTLEKVEIYRNPYDREFPQTTNLLLTEEQATAIEPIYEALDQRLAKTFLLHGVTGSGKTEIYLQAIEKVITKGQEAIVLVPEISLTPLMVDRFKGRFGSKVAVLHSALSIGEKYDEWRKIQAKEVQVVVGARSAVFAPFENLGIIIIDEEHETTYKQEESPRYHARDVAIKRSEINNFPVILGSATPTLESFARAKKDVYELLTLTKRTNKQAMPEIETIDMREELHAGNRTMFSRILLEKIRDRIKNKQQIVLLLNRRGYSNFALCRDCGHVEECPNCDISLTYHKRNNALKCHYCLHEIPMPVNCPACTSDLIRFFGTGTQRVEEALYDVIPEARVIRMDVDTTSRKGAHEKLLQQFGDQKADILLGTQMIAKGLDFENVTLVGVLAADSMLHLPDFRSSEKTFQQITQVSGRAGRHELTGEVIVQSYTPEHYSIQLASTYNFKRFYEQEMTIRRTFLYPPYVFLVLFTVSHENEMFARNITQQIRQHLGPKLQQNSSMLGPSPSPIARMKNRYRYQLIVKYRQEPQLQTIIKETMDKFQDELRKNLQITVDFNPQQLM